MFTDFVDWLVNMYFVMFEYVAEYVSNLLGWVL